MKLLFPEPVVRTTLTDDVCRKLAAQLVSGHWKEGDRFPSERDLGQLLGVGRASLREALKALEILGMIESRAGNGTFVCHRSQFLSGPLLWSIAGNDPSQAHELIETRRLLEGELASLAAQRGTPEDLERIALHVDRMERGLGNTAICLNADVEFHFAISQAAHNRLLLNAVQLIRNLMRQWINKTLKVPGTPAEALRQHKDILTAIANKDKAGAQAAMFSHLDEMAKVLLCIKGAVDINGKQPASPPHRRRRSTSAATLD